jgi:hypothetical protein
MYFRCMFHLDVACVLSGCCICCNGYTRILQVYVSNVSSVSEVCCKCFVGVRTRGGPRLTSKCCVSLSWMVMQGEHTEVYPGSGKRRPYVQRGEGEICISLHRGACVGVTSLRERVVSPGLKRRKKKYKMIAWDVDLYLVYGRLSVVFRLAPVVEPRPSLL